MAKRNKKFTWSFSALNDFETCPRRYAELKVFRRYREAPNDAAIWGQRAHEELARAIERGEPLSKALQGAQPVVDKLRAIPYRLRLVEAKAAFDEDMELIGWGDKAFFDKRVWFRCVLDVGIVLENWKDVLIVDHKTGRPKDDPTQLKLFAKAMFAAYPRLERARTGFFWLKTGTMDSRVYSRDEVDAWWKEQLLPRVARMRTAWEERKYDPRPCGLCARYCPVRREHCVYSERR